MEGNSYRKILNEAGFVAFVPKGNSMWPTLINGGQSVVLLPKKGRLKAMDVAMYERSDGSVVLHRVVGIKDDGYIFCGDSLVQREFVKEENVFAVMQGFYRKRKYIETDSDEFKKESEKLYRNEEKRIKNANRFFFRIALKNRIADFFSKLKRG